MEYYVLLSAFASYVMTSLVLLKFPQILHKKKEKFFKANHISHRGGAGEQLENTMEAFRNAIKHGTQLLEIDCHVTKDGEVVISHDNDISRSTGCNQLISETLYKDLPPLQRKLRVSFSADMTCECGDDHKRQYALLREVFTELPNVPVNIDIKIDSDELIYKVNELVKEFNREKLTVWGSMRQPVAVKLYDTNSEIPLFFSIRRAAVVFVQFYTGILPFVPIKESYFEIPMPSALKRMALYGTSEFTWKQRIFMNVLDYLLMNRMLIRHMQARGITVYMWVLNTEEDYKRACELGADGIMTDYPAKLERFLQDNPQYNPQYTPQYSQ